MRFTGGSDDRRHPRPLRDTRRREFGGHATRTHSRRTSSGQGHDLVIECFDLRNQGGCGIKTRIRGQQPRGVSEQNERGRTNETGDQRRKAVVITKANLLIRDGIVLIDDWHHTQRPQRLNRAASMEILRAIGKVVRSEEYLSDGEAVGSESVTPRVHQKRLTHRRHGLQRLGVGGPGSTASNGRPAGRDGPARDHDNAEVRRS